jgi:triacylglycerol lipase
MALLVATAACAAPTGVERSSGTESDAELRGKDVPIGAEPAGLPARYPIVLMHGFNAAPDSWWSFNAVEEALAADGHVAYETTTYPFRSVHDRASLIAAQLDEILATHERVHIVAHSMGGLDARYLVSTLGYADRVASITTLATPHGGTPVADFAIGPSSLAESAVNALAEALGKSYSDVANDPDILGALRDLSVENAPWFDLSNPDDERVMYFSWADLATVGGREYSTLEEDACRGLIARRQGDKSDRLHVLLYATQAVISAQPGVIASDGLVPTESMHHGTFRGCLPVDHFEVVGRGGPDDGNPRTGFDHIRFYRSLAYELASLEGCAPADVVCDPGEPWGDWPTHCSCRAEPEPEPPIDDWGDF